MTQDERWIKRYEEVMAFIESNHRNPSKHRIEEHDMLNWVKANRKAINAGRLKEERERHSRGSQLPQQISANCHIKIQPTVTLKSGVLVVPIGCLKD